MPSRSWHARGCTLAGAGALLAALVLPGTARSESNPTLKKIATSQSLGGLNVYDTFTVPAGVIVTVLPLGQGTGSLTIQANVIDIEGTIIADGAGYAGASGMAGGCSSQANGMCAAAGSMMGYPGGGGGFFGPGGNGATEATAGMCTDLGSGAKGGAAFLNMTTPVLDLGSAGGAANNQGTIAPGYPGGGVIHLAAGQLIINGTVSANGAGSPAGDYHGGVGPGGGSGGAIELTAAVLTGNGTLSVKGGNGAHGAGVGTVPANDGGGGSGGLVLVHLPQGLTMPTTITIVDSGGQTGSCSSLAGGTGGVVTESLPAACLDLDGDGYASTSCDGGTDCNDVDPAIHPGAPELCNGIDDNCSGVIDGTPNDCTAKGEVCITPPGDAGPSCAVENDAGVSDGGDAPTEIEFSGGCSLPDRATRTFAGASLLALGLMAFAARRRPRARRGG